MPMPNDALITEPITSECSYFRSQSTENVVDKKLVAETLLSRNLIRSGDPVVIDAGTSATIVAEAIFKSDKLRNLSILTHNIEAFQLFYKVHKGGHEVLLTGGGFDSSYNALYGKVAENAYEGFNARVVIIAISGLTAFKGLERQSGVYCHAVVETRIKEILFKLPAERRIVVADYSKIARVDSHLFGTMAEFKSNVWPGGDYLITTRPRSTESPAVIEAFSRTIGQLQDWKVQVIPISVPEDAQVPLRNAPDLAAVAAG